MFKSLPESHHSKQIFEIHLILGIELMFSSLWVLQMFCLLHNHATIEALPSHWQILNLHQSLQYQLIDNLNIQEDTRTRVTLNTHVIWHFMNLLTQISLNSFSYCSFSCTICVSMFRENYHKVLTLQTRVMLPMRQHRA